MYFLNVVTTLMSVAVVGGPLFLVAAFLLGLLYFRGTTVLFSNSHRCRSTAIIIDARLYGRCSRDMRRLGELNLRL